MATATKTRAFAAQTFVNGTNYTLVVEPDSTRVTAWKGHQLPAALSECMLLRDKDFPNVEQKISIVRKTALASANGPDLACRIGHLTRLDWHPVLED